MQKMKSDYEDIIQLPNHRSSTHPHLSMEQRAAQFAKFAALTGHEDAIREKARHTDAKLQLDESAIEELDQILKQLRQAIKSRPEVTVTYFRPDEKKSGGVYLTCTDSVVRIDDRKRVIQLLSGQTIDWDNLYKIEPVRELFETYE